LDDDPAACRQQTGSDSMTESEKMTGNHSTRIISRAIERMAAASHLPGDLVTLLGQTALRQAETGSEICLDLSGQDLSGAPICPPDRLPIDPKHLRDLADRILDLVLDPGLGMPAPMADAARTVRAALETGELGLEAALAEVLGRFTGQQDSPVLSAWAAKMPDVPAFLAFLTMAAAAPSLEAGAQGLADAAGLAPDRIRSQGACPICGSLPFMLELRGKEGQRYAHCACCRHTYRIRRLACACCDSDDAEALTYFTAEGEPGYRVETCSHCNTYVKTIDFRNLDREAFAPLNDLESLSLDILAGDQEYQRMAPSVWQI